MPVDTYLRSVYVSNRGRVEASERGPWQSSFLRRNTTREHLPTSASGPSGGPSEAGGANPVVGAASSRASPASSAAGGAEMSALARAFEKKRLAIVASLRHRTKLSMVLFCPLMVLIMLLATLVSFSRTVPSGGDALSSVYPAASMVRGPPGRGADREKFTVMINTYRRHDMAKDAVQHYANCERVDAIRVVWSENGSAPQEATDKQWFSSKKPVFYDKYETTSLNNRFIPPEGLATDSVFAVDDDIRVPCADLEFAHEVWKVADGSLVGFMPRIHTPDPKGQFFRYNGWWKVWWDGEYSLVLTKAAFLHRNFLKAYTDSMPQQIRDYVDANRNCEDIAMQFMASNLTGKPPIFVRGHLTDLGVFKGISTKSWTKLTHMKSRGQCLNDFVELYGGVMPLVKGRIVAGPASSWWFNQPSTVFDYFSSDMLMGKGSGGGGLPSIRQAKASYIVPPLALGILVILKLLS